MLPMNHGEDHLTRILGSPDPSRLVKGLLARLYCVYPHLESDFSPAANEEGGDGADLARDVFEPGQL